MIGHVREAIRMSVETIVGGGDDLFLLEVKPEGLFQTHTAIAHSGCRGSGTSTKKSITSPAAQLGRINKAAGG